MRSGSLFQNLLLLFLFNCTLATPLDDYVRKPDPHYSWTELNYTFSGAVFNDDYTAHVLNMTSQKWLDETIVSLPIWYHALVVVIPSRLRFPDATLLYISGKS